MASHTPGPWTLEPDIRMGERQIGQQVTETLSGYNIASTSGEIVGCEGILPDGEANARLIAAAPDMFSALRVVRMSAGWSIMSDEARALVIEALAKAETA